MAWKHGRHLWSYLYLANGKRHRISLDTADKATALEMERMLSILRSRREWEPLEAALSGRTSVGELYDYWRVEDLQALSLKLSDVDLRDHVQGWQSWLKRRLGHDSDSPEEYLRQLRVLIPEDRPAPRSAFRRKAVSSALSHLDVTGSTVRRYAAAWSSFFSYLVEIEVVEANPLREIAKPRENASRETFLSIEDSLRLVHAHVGPYRALAALREGAGVEIGACLQTKRKDVDVAARLIHAHGTKRVHRDRIVQVDEEFWPFIAEHVRDLLPDAELWSGISYHMAYKQHRAACKAIGLKGYRLHDSRHSYAVRHMKRGDDPTLIANNLGHFNAAMVLKVYGKYRPKPEDYARARASGRA